MVLSVHVRQRVDDELVFTYTLLVCLEHGFLILRMRMALDVCIGFVPGFQLEFVDDFAGLCLASYNIFHNLLILMFNSREKEVSYGFVPGECPTVIVLFELREFELCHMVAVECPA